MDDYARAFGLAGEEAAAGIEEAWRVGIRYSPLD
jgi:hypothetical protein